MEIKENRPGQHLKEIDWDWSIDGKVTIGLSNSEKSYRSVDDQADRSVSHCGLQRKVTNWSI